MHFGKPVAAASNQERDPASEPLDPGMLYHTDGTPYMRVDEYKEQRGDPPRLRYPASEPESA